MSRLRDTAERKLRAAFKEAMKGFKLEDGDIILVKDADAWAMVPALVSSLSTVTSKKVAFLFAPNGLEKVSVQDLKDAINIVEPARIIVP